MKAVVSSANFLSGLKRIVGVVNNNSVIPIMNNVKISTGDGSLLMTGLNPQMANEATVSADILDPGTTTMPMKKLYQIASALPHDDVVIETVSDLGDVVSITCGKASYRIIGLSPEGFPEKEPFAGARSFQIDARAFVASLNQVSTSICDDASRHTLNGVLLELSNGNLSVVATDGRRLATVQHEIDYTIGDDEKNTQIIISAITVMELIKTIDVTQPLSINFNNSSVEIQSGETVITALLVEGTYPNYRSVMPESFAHSMSVDRLAMLGAVKRMALVLDNSEGVTFTAKENEMNISATSARYGTAQESIELDLSGEPMTFTLNADFLVQPLAKLDCDKLIIQYNSPDTPMALRDGSNFLYILMPMRQ